MITLLLKRFRYLLDTIIPQLDHIQLWLVSHLNSGLGETYFAGQLLPGEDIWVVSLIEDCLQLLELLEGECRPVPPLLPPQEGLVMHVRGVTECGVCNQVRSVSAELLLERANLHGWLELNGSSREGNLTDPPGTSRGLG